MEAARGERWSRGWGLLLLAVLMQQVGGRGRPGGATGPWWRLGITPSRRERELVPQPLLASLFLRDSWPLPGFGIMKNIIERGELSRELGVAKAEDAVLEQEQRMTDGWNSYCAGGGIRTG
jgi:hypothetical protein